MRSSITNTIFFIAILLCIPQVVYLQSGGKITGKVTSEVNGAPLADVSVTLRPLNRSAQTAGDGSYEFADVPNGTYTVVTHIEGFPDRALTVRVSGATANLDFSLSLAGLREEVTVTASGSEQSVFESFQSVNSVGSTRIREQANTSIGEVLEREAGVSKRSFGPGSSRPSIRGFEGDRVLILQDGLRNGSLGNQSGDHGEPVDTLNLERVEIIKGPATLLYGSSAIGGVVNAVTGDEDSAHPGLRGYFTGLGGSNNKQGGVAGGIEFGYKNFLSNFSGNLMREGDFTTPLGKIPNSASVSRGGTFSAGYYGKKVFFSGYANLDRRRYGTPYSPLYESGELLSIANGGIDCGSKEEGEEPTPCQFNVYAIRDAFANELPPVPEEEIDIKMRRNNFRFRGGFHDIKGPIQRGNFFVDFSDYRHQEIEAEPGAPEEIATTFDNDVFSYRAVFQQANYQKLSGQFGFEGFSRSYLTSGAEQLIDGKVKQENIAFFGLQELSFDRVALQFGGRVENNRFRPANTGLYADRSFTEFSGAAAARFRLWQGASFVANFTTSARNPSLEELYNFGPHIGTVTFEVGDQNLRTERSNGIEVSLRQQTKRLRIDSSIFYYNIHDFIYLQLQDEDGDGNIEVEDGLPIGNFVQNDARFYGADLSIDYELNKYFAPFFIADVVSARLQNSNTPLPRITPARVRMGLDFRFKGLSVRPEGVFAFNKSAADVAPLETPTRGYGYVNVNASYTYAHNDKVAHIFTFSAQNLNDKLYRNHSSFIKDLMPEAGRGIRASYTVRFF